MFEVFVTCDSMQLLKTDLQCPLADIHCMDVGHPVIGPLREPSFFNDKIFAKYKHSASPLHIISPVRVNKCDGN